MEQPSAAAIAAAADINSADLFCMLRDADFDYLREILKGDGIEREAFIDTMYSTLADIQPALKVLVPMYTNQKRNQILKAAAAASSTSTTTNAAAAAGAHIITTPSASISPRSAAAVSGGGAGNDPLAYTMSMSLNSGGLAVNGFPNASMGAIGPSSSTTTTSAPSGAVAVIDGVPMKHAPSVSAIYPSHMNALQLTYYNAIVTMFNLIDVNNNGDVSWEEFSHYMVNTLERSAEANAADAIPLPTNGGTSNNKEGGGGAGNSHGSNSSNSAREIPTYLKFHHLGNTHVKSNRVVSARMLFLPAWNKIALLERVQDDHQTFTGAGTGSNFGGGEEDNSGGGGVSATVNSGGASAIGRGYKQFSATSTLLDSINGGGEKPHSSSNAPNPVHGARDDVPHLTERSRITLLKPLSRAIALPSILDDVMGGGDGSSAGAGGGGAGGGAAGLAGGGVGGGGAAYGKKARQTASYLRHQSVVLQNEFTSEYAIETMAFVNTTANNSNSGGGGGGSSASAAFLAAAAKKRKDSSAANTNTTTMGAVLAAKAGDIGGASSLLNSLSSPARGGGGGGDATNEADDDDTYLPPTAGGYGHYTAGDGNSDGNGGIGGGGSASPSGSRNSVNGGRFLCCTTRDGKLLYLNAVDDPLREERGLLAPMQIIGQQYLDYEGLHAPAFTAMHIDDLNTTVKNSAAGTVGGGGGNGNGKNPNVSAPSYSLSNNYVSTNPANRRKLGRCTCLKWDADFPTFLFFGGMNGVLSMIDTSNFQCKTVPTVIAEFGLPYGSGVGGGGGGGGNHNGSMSASASDYPIRGSSNAAAAAQNNSNATSALWGGGIGGISPSAAAEAAKIFDNSNAIIEMCILPERGTKRVVTAYANGRLRLFDITTQLDVGDFLGATSATSLETIKSLTSPVFCMTYHSHYSLLITCGIGDIEPVVWSPFAASNRFVKKLTDPSDTLRPYSLRTLTHAEAIPNSPYVVTADVGGMLKVWDLRSMSVSVTQMADGRTPPIGMVIGSGIPMAAAAQGSGGSAAVFGAATGVSGGTSSSLSAAGSQVDGVSEEEKLAYLSTLRCRAFVTEPSRGDVITYCRVLDAHQQRQAGVDEEEEDAEDFDDDDDDGTEDDDHDDDEDEDEMGGGNNNNNNSQRRSIASRKRSTASSHATTALQKKKSNDDDDDDDNQVNDTMTDDPSHRLDDLSAILDTSSADRLGTRIGKPPLTVLRQRKLDQSRDIKNDRMVRALQKRGLLGGDGTNQHLLKRIQQKKKEKQNSRRRNGAAVKGAGGGSSVSKLKTTTGGHMLHCFRCTIAPLSNPLVTHDDELVDSSGGDGGPVTYFDVSDPKRFVTVSRSNLKFWDSKTRELESTTRLQIGVGATSSIAAAALTEGSGGTNKKTGAINAAAKVAAEAASEYVTCFAVEDNQYRFFVGTSIGRVLMYSATSQGILAECRRHYIYPSSSSSSAGGNEGSSNPANNGRKGSDAHRRESLLRPATNNTGKGSAASPSRLKSKLYGHVANYSGLSPRQKKKGDGADDDEDLTVIGALTASNKTKHQQMMAAAAAAGAGSGGGGSDEAAMLQFMYSDESREGCAVKCISLTSSCVLTLGADGIIQISYIEGDSPVFVSRMMATPVNGVINNITAMSKALPQQLIALGTSAGTVEFREMRYMIKVSLDVLRRKGGGQCVDIVSLMDGNRCVVPDGGGSGNHNNNATTTNNNNNNNNTMGGGGTAPPTNNNSFVSAAATTNTVAAQQRLSVGSNNATTTAHVFGRRANSHTSSSVGSPYFPTAAAAGRRNESIATTANNNNNSYAAAANNAAAAAATSNVSFVGNNTTPSPSSPHRRSHHHQNQQHDPFAPSSPFVNDPLDKLLENDASEVTALALHSTRPVCAAGDDRGWVHTVVVADLTSTVTKGSTHHPTTASASALSRTNTATTTATATTAATAPPPPPPPTAQSQSQPVNMTRFKLASKSSSKYVPAIATCLTWASSGLLVVANDQGSVGLYDVGFNPHLAPPPPPHSGNNGNGQQQQQQQYTFHTDPCLLFAFDSGFGERAKLPIKGLMLVDEHSLRYQRGLAMGGDGGAGDVPPLGTLVRRSSNRKLSALASFAKDSSTREKERLASAESERRAVASGASPTAAAAAAARARRSNSPTPPPLASASGGGGGGAAASISFAHLRKESSSIGGSLLDKSTMKQSSNDDGGGTTNTVDLLADSTRIPNEEDGEEDDDDDSGRSPFGGNKKNGKVDILAQQPRGGMVLLVAQGSHVSFWAEDVPNGSAPFSLLTPQQQQQQLLLCGGAAAAAGGVGVGGAGGASTATTSAGMHHHLPPRGGAGGGGNVNSGSILLQQPNTSAKRFNNSSSSGNHQTPILLGNDGGGGDHTNNNKPSTISFKLAGYLLQGRGTSFDPLVDAYEVNARHNANDDDDDEDEQQQQHRQRPRQKTPSPSPTKRAAGDGASAAKDAAAEEGEFRWDL